MLYIDTVQMLRRVEVRWHGNGSTMTLYTPSYQTTVQSVSYQTDGRDKRLTRYTWSQLGLA